MGANISWLMLLGVISAQRKEELDLFLWIHYSYPASYKFIEATGIKPRMMNATSKIKTVFMTEMKTTVRYIWIANHLIYEDAFTGSSPEVFIPFFTWANSYIVQWEFTSIRAEGGSQYSDPPFEFCIALQKVWAKDRKKKMLILKNKFCIFIY